MKNIRPKNRLLIAAAVFITIVVIVAIVSTMAGHPAPAAAAATVAAVASVEVARRKLAGAAAVIEVKEEVVETLKASFEENLADAEAKETANAKDIAAMTLEEKVALANGAESHERGARSPTDETAPAEAKATDHGTPSSLPAPRSSLPPKES